MVPGNEIADSYARAAAELQYDPVDRGCLREASLSHLTRKPTEARIKRARERVQDHVRSERRYRPPKGGRIRQHLRKERKEVASRYFQLLANHASTGPSSGIQRRRDRQL